MGWEALAHVRPLREDHCLDRRAGGAYVRFLGLAQSETALRETLSAQLAELGLFLVELDDVGMFDPVTVDWHDDELQELTKELSTETPIRFRAFHNYPREDFDA